MSDGITFVIVRGLLALAAIGAAIYCIMQGIHYWALPRAEAQLIDINIFGAHLNASGLAGVIFAAGVAFGVVAVRLAPKQISTTSTKEKGSPEANSFVKETSSKTYSVGPRF